MGSDNNRLQATKVQTRLLLALWGLAGTENKVTKGKLSDRAGRKKANAGVYDKIYQQLETEGAIAVVGNKRVVNVSLTDKGLQALGEGLKSSDFSFEGTIVGTWAANALLRWMRQTNSTSVSTPELVNGVKSAIASYDEFKLVALEIYDKLNQNYNMDDLVPIYRIRREIGEKVTREEFNNWLLEMQTNDILQLQGGSVEDSAPDKIEDSITTKVNGLRCYAQRLSS
ncbi:hypothetical protein [Brunnivagina elsteri]|uniref:Uncharacterized protein n=1 Tax=Brunnivagina elsteri CCALA 953 TaxID=987040 RepID=A0A2A2TDW1_9CYAN|nr:hypothetical protein [Calothrix elsteri]PAX51940.1 hypothetical protein CK510_22025 [Calothrix elsteri CCALA 953]